MTLLICSIIISNLVMRMVCECVCVWGGGDIWSVSFFSSINVRVQSTSSVGVELHAWKWINRFRAWERHQRSRFLEDTTAQATLKVQ